MYRAAASSGQGYRCSMPLVVAFGMLSLAGAGSDPLVEEKSGVTVDWRRGAIVATGGAAADHRMPSAEVARPGAERRARATARARIAEALHALPLGGGRRLDDAAVARAVGRARPTNVEYQSNGGALVRMELAFGDWIAGGPEVSSGTGGAGGEAGGDDPKRDQVPVALSLPAGRLAAAPVLVIGGREVMLGSARYSTASAGSTAVRPLPVRADRQGRLVLDKGVAVQELAGRPALIYVQKILR